MADGRQVPLLSVARWRTDEGLGTCAPQGPDRVATVSSDVRAGEQSQRRARRGEGRAAAGRRGRCPPATCCATPASRRTSRSPWASSVGAFLLALLLIAFILMSQFNSVLKPLIIMTSVVMSTVGVLLG
jgi:multidrug efflux pump